MMGDHLFDPTILSVVLDKSAADSLNLAVDKKLGSIFDIDDAMKVQTAGDRVVTLGKNLEIYDAIDTGIFLCPNELFDYLHRAQSQSRESDCNLADGVRLMAANGKVRAIDIGPAWWQDVDTPEMRAHAEENLGVLARLKS
jgi:choline kinase